MPQVEIDIGGRTFEVACQDGEEPFLRAAAKMLDTEASALSTQIGRMPEARMLLMAGLLLADKTAALEDKLREAEGRIEEMVYNAEMRAKREAEAEPQRVEVPVVPAEVLEMLAEVAAQSEALADAAEERIGAA
ncbi:cell division protein ZapA [Flavimaricola marinus]|uniref:Cell division protein ZapA n=1 Tax=Flavimaricola marinus TaxID=1819565 RepID=A0A238LDZ7_9RHOB|nr:cell division protein ZapA [Flavimaricola marinus]SMY07937.1 Cell division protein ZapA [Flavimaricola marinus]